MHLCFVLFLVCLYVCVCECLLHNMRIFTSNQYSYVLGPLQECCSSRSGTSLLLHTTCVHLCCNWAANCVAAQQTKNQKPKTKNSRCTESGLSISRTDVDSQWNQVYNAFHPIFCVETKRFVGSVVNVILTRQTCGQHSSRAAESERRALEKYFPEWICYMFRMSKCRGDRDLGWCTFWVLANVWGNEL